MVKRGPHHANITWLPHLRVAWGGTLGTGKEVFTNSLKFHYLDEAFVPTEAQKSTMDPLIWEALRQWFTITTPGFASFIGQAAKMTWLKLNSINAQGLQINQATHIYEAGAPFNGADANEVPFYQTYALTLRTAIKRGRGHAGRIFPPCVQPLLVTGTGMCGADDATSMAAGFGAKLTQIANAITTNSQVGSFAVFSPGDSLKGTTPLAFPITGVVADRVPDVQHRRTNKIPRSEGVLAATV